MTNIDILGGDFEILFEDEKFGENTGPGLRMIRRKSGASATVYSTNQLYSAVADAADDFVAMGFRNPMLPTTPNAYTMENRYFIPRSSTQFLKEGSITANWGLTASPDTDGNGVLKVKYLVGAGDTDFASTDIGKQVTAQNGDTGTLLDFDVDQDGTKVAWIRPVDSTPTTGDIFDGGNNQTLVVNGTGAVGDVTQVANAVEGDHIFSAIQAIGSVPTATDVYVVQDRNKLSSWDGTFQWWTTDPAVSLGIISILVQVKDSGTFVADGDVEVFARRYTALYDNFRLRVQAGGFSALPLASAADINNTTGYRTTNLSSSTGTWTAGNGIYQGANWATATARGVITGGDNLGTADPDVEYYLVGDLTELSTGAVTTKEYDFATSADADASATTVDSVGVNLGGPTDTASGEGGTVTIELGGFDVDHTGDGTTEPYSIQVDAQSNVPIAKVYERLKYVTRRGADELDLFSTGGTNAPQYGPAFNAATDVDDVGEDITFTSHEYQSGDKVVYDDGGGTGIGGLTSGNTYFLSSVDANTVAVHNTYADALYDQNRINLTDGVGAAHTLTRVINIPGETYRGLDGVFEYDANTGTMREGENALTTTGGSTWTGRLFHQNSTNSPTYITVSDQQTSIDSIIDNDVIDDVSGDDVTVHAGGTLGLETFTSPKSSPFGTFTGTQIFGARGVAFVNPATGNEQSYILTDDLGVLNEPPNTVTFTVTNTAAGDRILVARDTGTSGIIDKNQHGTIATPAASYNRVGDSEIRGQTALDNDVPQSGYVRVVDNTNQEEHHYVYSSINRTNSSFVLKAIPDATVTTADTADAAGQAQLIASAATFVTSGVEVGMLVRVTTAAKRDHIWEVVSVDSETQLTCVQLFGPDLGDASMDFDISDVCEINKVIGKHDSDTTPTDYDVNTDYLYDLILDLEASGTSVSNNFTKDTSPATFGVVVNVRQGKIILPFTLNQTQGQGSTTVTVVRQPDTIAT